MSNKRIEAQEEFEYIGLEELRKLCTEKYKEMIELISNQPDNKRNKIIELLSVTLQDLQEKQPK